MTGAARGGFGEQIARLYGDRYGTKETIRLFLVALDGSVHDVAHSVRRDGVDFSVQAKSYVIDLSTPRGCQEFVDGVLSQLRGGVVHRLYLNHGALAYITREQSRTTAQEVYDYIQRVNYLSYTWITDKLLARGAISPSETRLGVTASTASFENAALAHNAFGLHAYAVSKIAAANWTIEVRDKFLSTTSCHPVGNDTRMVRGETVYAPSDPVRRLVGDPDMRMSQGTGLSLPSVWPSYMLVSAPPASTMFNHVVAVEKGGPFSWTFDIIDPLMFRLIGPSVPALSSWWMFVAPLFFGDVSYGKIFTLMCTNPVFLLLALPYTAWPLNFFGYFLPGGPHTPPNGRKYVNGALAIPRMLLLHYLFFELYLLLLAPFTGGFGLTKAIVLSLSASSGGDDGEGLPYGLQAVASGGGKL